MSKVVISLLLQQPISIMMLHGNKYPDISIKLSMYDLQRMHAELAKAKEGQRRPLWRRGVLNVAKGCAIRGRMRIRGKRRNGCAIKVRRRIRGKKKGWSATIEHYQLE